MSNGRGEMLIPQVVQLPLHRWGARELEQAGFRSPTSHGRWHFEQGWTERQTCTQGLDERFLYGPELVEQVEPVNALNRCEFRLLRLGEDGSNNGLQVALAGTLLDVHTQSSTVGKRDQPMATAMADIEADRGRPSSEQGHRLSVLKVEESDVLIPATQAHEQN